jgi:hypothetical protein
MAHSRVSSQRTHARSHAMVDRPLPASRHPRAPRHPSLSMPWPVNEARVHFTTSHSRSTFRHAHLLHSMPLQLLTMTTVPQVTQSPPVSPISSSSSWCSIHKEICHTRFLSQNLMLIVCVPRNKVYTHTVQKMDTE